MPWCCWFFFLKTIRGPAGSLILTCISIPPLPSVDDSYSGSKRKLWQPCGSAVFVAEQGYFPPESPDKDRWDDVVNHLPSFIFSAGHCSHLPWSLSRLPAMLAQVQVSAVKRREQKGIHLKGRYFKVSFHVEGNISSNIRTHQSHNHDNVLWTGLKYLCLRQQCFTRPV